MYRGIQERYSYAAGVAVDELASGGTHRPVALASWPSGLSQS